MFRLHARKRLLKRLAQTAPAAVPDSTSNDSSGTTTPTTTTPTATQPATIDVRSLPGFKSQLFSLRPDFVLDIQAAVNIINKYLLLLTNNKLDFTFVYQTPGVSGSEFSNSTKNLVNLSKWLYSVMKADQKTYSMQGLYAIAQGLMTMVNGYSFPDSNAVNAKPELVAIAQRMAARLGAV